MKQTTNYKFNKPELADSPPDITVLNSNFDKIDTELKSNADKQTELDKSITQVKNDYLPKTGGNITQGLTVKNKTVAVSVNGSTADANGNITIDVGGDVQSVNGVQPDSNGNVVLDLGGDVQSVDGVEPDANGNVQLDALKQAEVLEATKRVTDVEVNASVATHEGLQTAVARVEANLDAKLPLSGGKMTGSIVSSTPIVIKQATSNSYTTICSGTGTSDGARLVLCSKGDSDSGQFKLYAKNNDNQQILVGFPDGSLKWDGKEVDRVNSSGTYYIRYENGLQMCWGAVDTDPSGVTTTFPIAFSAVPIVVACRKTSENTTGGAMLFVRTITTTTVNIYAENSTSSRYIAIGYWK